ncbi:uncharacterized protein DUF4190 [Tamaricihabitans halophyticus]|uniref:Uncharacterized protein DUF4190 n=1 Tax=Tamaricihabitans halophyticus TaxID=1262583 RepID=A0A4R2R974_9PSEU|nr:DUF4190 domain-containing protein [Tamaricihabitans halophyticus]TCP56211.1 uncharacterized protein DUF4190 [Tamaricihabitans halophyticus]
MSEPSHDQGLGSQPQQGYPGMPPQYPMPQYPPPQYPPQQGAPMYYPQQMYPPVRTTNTLAVVALVMVFVFPPLGIVFGAIARKQINETGEDGQGLATAGLIGGIVVTVLYVLLVVLMLLMFVWLADTVNEVGRTTAT